MAGRLTRFFYQGKPEAERFDPVIGLIFQGKQAGKEAVRISTGGGVIGIGGNYFQTFMTYVHQALVAIPANLTRVALVADRHTIVKRRWRGVAADGREFSFALDEPLVHGAVFHATRSVFYVLLQEPERIVEVPLGSAASAARVAWLIGSHHFPLEIRNGTIRVADAAAVRRLFAREHISFKERKAVFHPLKAGE